MQHDIFFDGLIFIDDGTGRPHDQFQENDMHRRKYIRVYPSKGKRYKNGEYNGDMNGYDVPDGLFKVAVMLQ